MSFPQDGRDMDQRPGAGGSVRNARERAQAMADEQLQMAKPSVPRRPVAGSTTGQPRTQRPQAPPGLQMKDGQRTAAISRPTQVPQWPLPGPLTSPPGSTDAEPYKPPPGKSQPPQRPPRPSRVPSMLDASKVQDPTPSFQYRPQPDRESTGQDQLSAPETPSSQSRPSTLSSVGSIPDFPLPVPLAPPRRSVNLGPPPSARRGASSFYSNLSYVSPIPEESPRSRSHTSFASSAAMPESWGTPSPGPSPNYPDASYEEMIAEAKGESYDEDGDESRLVRSASLGKKGKATLVNTPAMPRAADNGDSSQRPAPKPIQNDPFKDGTGYVDASSSSSSAIPTVKAPGPASVTADSILNAYGAAAGTTDSSNTSAPTPSPQPRGGRPYNRLSAIWRTPRPESDATTTKAEARASLTSLPDLIRRATRLAASLERGRRPASRFDDLNDSGPDSYGRYGDRDMSFDGEKHQSGFSDMLAAFPPPAQPRRSFRESLRLNIPSWPLPLNANRGNGNDPQDDMPKSQQKRGRNDGRRICGLPFWRFIIVVVIVLILVAAAIVIPLELFVLRKRNGPADSLAQCQAQLTCNNGGTNVVNRGVCSCICTGGFTGSTCNVAGATGCTTTSLAGDTNIDNVTLGNAIPRLIQQAQSNFSVALSPTTILAKLNAGNLSCSAENALVTFDGQSTPQNGITDSSGSLNAFGAADDGVVVEVVTVTVGSEPTVVVRRRTVAQPSVNVLPRFAPAAQAPSQVKRAPQGGFQTLVPAPATFSTIFATTIPFPDRTTTSTTTTTTTITSSSSTSTSTSGGGGGIAPTPVPGSGFTPAETTVDFARVAVLFVLQETTLDAAESAQITLQQLFADANGRAAGGVDVDRAKNVTLGNGNSIDLVNLVVHTASGAKGGKGASSSSSARRRSMRGLPCERLGDSL